MYGIFINTKIPYNFQRLLATMPRRSAPSVSLVARVRAWFGLRQAELALFLGVSPALVQHLESGQRALTAGVVQALAPLLLHLPATLAAPEPAASLPPGTTVPESAELDFRRRVCLQQAARCRAELASLAQQAHVAQRWAQALPALLAAAPPDPATTEADAIELAAWRTGWLHRRARPLPPEAATRWHLLAARATALEAEAAVLAAALDAA